MLQIDKGLRFHFKTRRDFLPGSGTHEDQRAHSAPPDTQRSPSDNQFLKDIGREWQSQYAFGRCSTLWKTFVEFAVRDFETLRGLQGMDGERVQFDDEIQNCSALQLTMLVQFRTALSIKQPKNSANAGKREEKEFLAVVANTGN